MMNITEIQHRLNEHGFPCGHADGQLGPRTRYAVMRFQNAYCGPGGWLEIDGIPGPRTQEAMGFLPRLSTHFTVWELRSKGDGSCYVIRELLSGLEVVRGVVGPVHLLSAYRDPEHNRKVGGVDYSTHRYGAGVDVNIARTRIAEQVARRAGWFSGIGTRGHLVSHLDVRHVLGSANRTPGATPENPARWSY